jgi:hypothetical protein
MQFAMRAITKQPLSYLKAVAKDFTGTFLLDRTYLFPRHGPAVDDNYAGEALKAYNGSARGVRQIKPFSSLIGVYQSSPIFSGALFALILFGALFRLLSRRRYLGPAVLPWSVAFVMILVPCMVHQTNYRYTLPAASLACMALALTFSPRKVSDLPR